MTDRARTAAYETTYGNPYISSQKQTDKIIDAFIRASVSDLPEDVAGIIEDLSNMSARFESSCVGNSLKDALDTILALQSQLTALSAEKQELAMQALSLSGELETLQTELTATRKALETEAEGAIAGLAYAMQDAENNTKMADLSEADRKVYFARAEQVNRWLKVHGYVVRALQAPEVNPCK